MQAVPNVCPNRYINNEPVILAVLIPLANKEVV